MRKPGRLLVRDIIIDPARGRELINSKFSTDNALFLIRNDRGEVGGRYDALPAAVAAEPTAFGCVVCDGDGESGSPTLVAILWDGVAARFHKLSPVVGSTSTVAEAGGASSATGGGLQA